MKHLLLPMVALAVLASPVLARSPDRPAQACLMVGQVYDFKALPGNKSLVVTDRSRKQYKVSLNGYCRSLDYNLALGFQSIGGNGLSCLTRGDMVISRDVAGPPDRCVIQTIEAYTPAMQKADAHPKTTPNR